MNRRSDAELLRAVLEALDEPDYNNGPKVGWSVVKAVFDYRSMDVKLLNEARVAVGLAPVPEGETP